MSDSSAKPARPGASALGHVAGVRTAAAAAGCSSLTDLAGMVMGSWDTPAPGLSWLEAGAIGQVGLALAAVTVLVAGVARSRWRGAAVVMAGALIAVEVAWFLRTRMLAAS